MRIFLSELRKLLGSVRIILVIAAAVIINVTLLVIPEFSDYPPAAYNKLWDRLDALPENERAKFVESRIADMFDTGYSGAVEAEFADSFYAEQELFKYVLSEIRQTDDYPNYLKSVDAAAENMKAMSFFSDENSFNCRNIIRTQEEFSKLGAENVVSDRSRGVLMAVRFGASDIIMILLILLFAVKLVTLERERGFFTLLRAAANGRVCLGLAKLSALIVSTAIAAFVVYGSSIVAGETVYGLGSLERGIQSVYGFFSCGSFVCVGQFLAEYMLTKLLFCAAFSAAVFTAAAMAIGSAAGYASVTAFAAVETALYYAISPTNIFAPLRQINLAAVADSAVLIGKYLNVNFFGFPINATVISVITSLIFAAACGVIGVSSFSGKTFERKRSVRKGLLSGKNTSLAAHELYKSFIGGKGIFILLAAAAVTIVLQKPVKPYYSDISDYVYYSYISDIQGEYTEEKSAYINAELEAAYLDFSEYGVIKQEALERLSRHAEYLKEKDGYFIKDMGYRMLTCDETVRVYDRLAAAVKTLFLIFAAAYSYSSEQRSGAIMLLRSSPNGRMRTFWEKMLSMTVCSILILVIFDGSRILGILNVWGTDFFTAPAYSMEHLSSVSMPIVLYVVITEIWRIVGMLTVSAATFFISGRVKVYSVSVILSAAVFAAPLVLSAIGFEFMDYFLADPLLIGNVI